MLFRSKQQAAISSTDPAPANRPSREQLRVTVEVNSKSGGLSLIGAATSYSIDLDGCLSGFTSTATELSNSMNVYKFDTGCLGKLTQFEIDGKTYSAAAVGSTDFSTWAVADIATFANVLDSGDTMRVEVMSQLQSPVVTSDVITYEFAQIDSTATEVVATSITGDGHVLTVNGNAAPSFGISEVVMAGMGAAGEGLFTFKLTCSVALAGNLCKDVDMVDVAYKLIEDTYSSTLSYAQADAEMGVGISDVTLPGDAHADGNGGFNTVSLAGPVTIFSKPNLILIVAVKNGGGTPIAYQYFNVDVTVQDNL